MVFRGANDTNKEFEDEYKHVLASSKFSMCPSGSGANSIRLWESLSYGSVPILLADTYILPPLRGFEWKDVLIVWKESELDTLHDYLKSFDVDRFTSMRARCVELFHAYFSPETFNRVILEYFA